MSNHAHGISVLDERGRLGNSYPYRTWQRGYRVTGAEGRSVSLSAVGAIAEEAIDRLAEQVRTRVHAGARLTELNVAPWAEDAGWLRDEPLYEPWREAMREKRRKLEADSSA